MSTRLILKISSVLCVLAMALNANAQNSNEAQSLKDSLDKDFSSFSKDIKSGFEGFSSETAQGFNSFRRQALAEYEAYVNKLREDYKKYSESIRGTWGGDSIVDNTKSTWVEYSDDYKERSVVDFEKGTVVVEIALDETESADSTEVNKLLAEAIENTLSSRGSTKAFPTSEEKSEPLSKAPILEGLVDFSVYSLGKTEMPDVDTKYNRVHARHDDTLKKSGVIANKAVNSVQSKNQAGVLKVNTKYERVHIANEEPVKETPVKKSTIRTTPEKETNSKKETVRDLAQAIAKQSNKTTSKVEGGDGKTRTVVRVQMNMVPNNLSKNAALYKDHVATYVQTYNIETSLVFAIMEQESNFNPRAKSWVPAIGLMQLVPRTAGVDAYKYVYKKEWVPDMPYLYDAKNNIELGTAYLRILYNTFRNVKDADCRRLCVIASYNTGAGNVARAFTGNTSVSRAVPIINTMKYNELYQYLTTKLRHEEARNYVSGVSRRREKYL